MKREQTTQQNAFTHQVGIAKPVPNSRNPKKINVLG